jgi:hypothetical protein
LKVFDGRTIRQFGALHKELFLTPLSIVVGQAFAYGKWDEIETVYP